MAMADGCRSWGVVIVVAAFLVQFITFGISSSIGVYNIQLLQEFDNDAVAVSLIGSINLGLFLGTGPLASYLMTRWEHRTISIFGSVLSSLGLVVIAFWQNLVVMCIFYGVVAGFGYCLAYIPSHVLSGLYFDKHRSLATGLATSGSGLGAAVFPLLIDALITRYGWKASLLLLAGINLHLIPIAALLRPMPRHKDVLVSSAPEDRGSNPACTSVQQTEEHPAGSVTEVPRAGVPNGLTFDNGGVSGVKPHLLSAASDTKMNKDDGFEYKPEALSKKSETSVSVGFGSSGKVVCRKSGKLKGMGNALITFNTGSVGMLDAVDEEARRNLLSAASFPRGTSTTTATEQALDSTSGPVIHSWRVFKDFAFNVYFLNNIAWNLGFGVYVAFAPAHFTLQGMTEQEAASMLMLVGFGNFVGGIIGGTMGNLPCCNRIAVFTAANVAVGAVMVAVPLVENFVTLVVLNVCLGLVFGIILGLLVILCVDLLGPQNLGTALGYLLLSNGVGVFVGPPLAGLLYNTSGNYVSSFFMAGGLIVAGGLVMVLIPLQAHFLPQMSLASRLKTQGSVL